MPVSPVTAGCAQGRTDQGVDYTGVCSLVAVDAGVILQVATGNTGWGPPQGAAPGAWILEQLDNPPDARHRYVYYAEGIEPGVSVGQHVAAGEPIGRCNGNSIEVGWASGIGTSTLAGGGSGATVEGQNFLAYLGGAQISLAGATTDSGCSADPCCIMCLGGPIKTPGPLPDIPLPSACVFSKGNAKAVGAALVIALGGLLMAGGIILLLAFALKSSGAIDGIAGLARFVPALRAFV